VADRVGGAAARQHNPGARRCLVSHRRGHSGRGIALADRAALRATNPALVALRQRYAGLQDLIGTAPFWRAGYVAEQDCFILGRQLLRLAVPGQQYIGKICSDVLVLKSIDTLGLFNVLTEAGDYGVFTFPTGDTDKEGNNNSSAATSWTRSVSCYFSNGRCKSRVGPG